MDVTWTSPLDARTLGRTGIEVTAVCLGTSPLSMPELYGTSVAEETGVATVLAALDAGILAIDTSNGYGDGDSERIVGEALRRRGGSPAPVLVASKVDPDPVTGDFSGRRARRSFEESLERLGLERLQLLYLHDPERIGFDASMAPDGPVATLLDLRDAGLVDRIGVAGGPIPLMRQFVETGLFDVALSHSRYSLLDRSALPLFEECARRGLGIVNAAPFGGGMLAKGPGVNRSYAYGQGSQVMAERAAAMQAACERHGVSLAVAALQFSLRSPLVEMTVVGASQPQRIAAALEEVDVPESLWDELESLVPPPASWLH